MSQCEASHQAGRVERSFGRIPSRLLQLVFPLLLVPAAAAAPASDVHALAQAVDSHYNHLRTLQTEFTETYR